MFLDEQERDKLIIVSVKELLNTVNKDYVKKKRNAKFEYEDSGLSEVMTLDEYLDEEYKTNEYSAMISQFQLYLFIDIWQICREYNIQLEKILNDLKIDLHDYFPSDAKRLFTGNKGLPKPELKIRTDYRPFMEITKTQIAPPPQQKEDKPEQLHPVIKPTFKPEAILTIFHELKDFFKPEQQAKLLEILKNGNNAGEKLLFRDNSNRLTDTFKKLIEHDFITGCPKKVLRDWICQNFEFLDGPIPKPFNSDTVTRTLSGGKAPCKSPLIEVIDGKITKALLPRQKNYNNY